MYTSIVIVYEFSTRWNELIFKGDFIFLITFDLFKFSCPINFKNEVSFCETQIIDAKCVVKISIQAIQPFKVPF